VKILNIIFSVLFKIVIVRSECHRNLDHYENSCYLYSDHVLTWYDAQVTLINW